MTRYFSLIFLEIGSYIGNIISVYHIFVWVETPFPSLWGTQVRILHRDMGVYKYNCLGFIFFMTYLPLYIQGGLPGVKGTFA